MEPIAEETLEQTVTAEPPPDAEPGFDPASREVLETSPQSPQPAVAGELGRLHAVPVEVAVEIGRTRMTIGEALALAPGSIVSLNRMAGDPVDLLVNGRAIARGEVVVIDEEFGLRVTELLGSPADG